MIIQTRLKFLFLIFLFPFQFFAGEIDKNIYIETIEIFVDSSKSMTLSQVRSNLQGFSEVKNGYSTPNKCANYWFRIKIKRVENYKKYYLSIHSGFHFDLTFYDEFTSKKCGLINKKYISHRNSNPFFEFVSSKSDTVEVFLKNDSRGAVENFYFNIVSEKLLSKEQENKQFVYGVFYGILILILVINLFYYFTIKGRVFLYYTKHYYNIAQISSKNT